MQCVSRGFHAVTKTPVRPAYLPCSKTREGVYPAVKVERKFSGIRFRGQPLALSSDCAVRENPLCCSGSVVQIELCCAASQSGNCGQTHKHISENPLKITGLSYVVRCVTSGPGGEKYSRNGFVFFPFICSRYFQHQKNLVC